MQGNIIDIVLDAAPRTEAHGPMLRTVFEHGGVEFRLYETPHALKTRALENLRAYEAFMARAAAALPRRRE